MVRTQSKRDESTALGGLGFTQVPVKRDIGCSMWIRTEN